MINFKLNIEQFAKSAENIVNEAIQAVDDETKASAINIMNDTNSGDSVVPYISGSTSYMKEGDAYIVNKGASLQHPELAAYSEFGTGNFAAASLAPYPEDWRKMAMDFFVNGQGRLPTHATLYPAFNKHTLPLLDNIKKKIEK